MGKSESYEDLIFQLGDMARDRLAGKPNAPRTMERVFKAEENLVAARDELQSLEGQLNEEDEAYRAFLEQQEAERDEQKEIVKKWKRAVEGIEARTKALRKSLISRRAELRYEKLGLKKTEERHRDLEMTQHHDQKKIALSQENLKKLRLLVMRKQREIEEMDREFNMVLTPKPGQPGAQGILAHKRILEMEDQADERREQHEQLMQELDEAIGAKESEVTAAEDFLDQALYLLGEEVYSLRIADPSLAVMYPRIDKIA